MSRNYRVIDLKVPLQVFALSEVFEAVACSYRVFALRVESSGRVFAIARDVTGAPVTDRALKRELASEAVRVLGLEDQVAERPRKARNGAKSDLIPQVWGLRLRGIGRRAAAMARVG
jgi:hypothetical protein